MKVGVISDHSDPRRGGAEAFVHSIVLAMRAMGHEVLHLSRTGPAAHPVRAHPASLRPLFYTRTFLPLLRARGVERIVSFTPVLGCDFYEPRHGILGASIPPHYESRAPLSRLLSRVNPQRRLHFAMLRHFEERTLAPPARCIAISPRVVEDLRRHYPRARDAILLRSGVDLDLYRPAGDAEVLAIRRRLGLPDGLLLLLVAHNFRLKGLPTAIAALRSLPEAHLVVVGRGRQVPAERVLWRGEDPALPEIYRAADVLVHPTWYDTASRVVLEALASGVPAITTCRDGNADHAEAGGGAALGRPGDPEALAAAVREVLRIPRADRVVHARARAEQFPADLMLSRMVEALTCAS